jgi:hypothetical protein
MNFAAAKRIALSILYEGYLLYPYRPSALKNQRRWTFGSLLPPDVAQPANSPEGSFSRIECLARGDGQTRVEVRGRFLQVLFRSADNMKSEEIVEREFVAGPFCLADLIVASECCAFEFTPIKAVLDVSAVECHGGWFKLRAELRNITPIPYDVEATREEALPFALLSNHLVLGIEGGRFASMQDPPTAVGDLANSCQSIRAWPILVGDPIKCDTLLATPIILTDFPEVAAESPGDFFDALEMDEMLTMRIRTLTDEEKREAAADWRVQKLLEQCDALDDRQLRDLHGVWRGEGETASVSTARETVEEDPPPCPPPEAGGKEEVEEQPNQAEPSNAIRPGSRVRLWPKGRADLFDIALAGKTAVVVSVERDLDDHVHVSVALDDDPGQDYGVAGRPGHRFFFRPDEIELLDEAGG